MIDTLRIELFSTNHAFVAFRKKMTTNVKANQECNVYIVITMWPFLFDLSRVTHP